MPQPYFCDIIFATDFGFDTNPLLRFAQAFTGFLTRVSVKETFLTVKGLSHARALPSRFPSDRPKLPKP